MVIVVLMALMSTQTMGQRSPWLAPKGTLLSRATALRERLHKPVMGPEDILPEEQGARGKEKEAKRNVISKSYYSPLLTCKLTRHILFV